MAEIIQEEKQKGGKKKPKKHAPHIDMTPMVDLMCLLITFFMLTTAFSKAKVMEINLPERVDAEGARVSAARTTNLIIGPNDKIYYYTGTVKEEQFNDLPPFQGELDFSTGDGGLRKFLLERNKTLARTITEYQQEVAKGTYGTLSADSVAKAIAKLKKDDQTGPIILIKAYKDSKYGNFVDLLDEMNICGVARYTIMDIAWYEERMVETATGITPAASTN